MSDGKKLGELNGWWAWLFKARQIAFVASIPIVLALFTVVIIPWCKAMDQGFVDLKAQVMLVQGTLPILKDVELRQREVVDRVTKLEAFANTGPRFTSKDADALETRIMLAMQKEQQSRFDVLLNRIDTLTEAINQLKVEMAAAGHLEAP